MAHLSSAKFDAEHGVWFLHQTPSSSFDLSRFVQLDSSFYPVLLESPVQGQLAQWDILMASPKTQFSLHLGEDSTPFLAQIDALLASDSWTEKPRSALNHLPFVGGWFFYFAYDYAQVVEPVLQLPGQQGDLLAHLMQCDAAICRSRITGERWFVAKEKADLARLLADTQACARVLEADKKWTVRLEEDAPEDYLSAVEQAKDYILSGDVFQANLSRKWQSMTQADFSPVQLYQQLRATNPAPFAALARLANQHWVMSSSPERLFSLDANWLNTRPIAGTRKRGEGIAEDEALLSELIGHPKERAEHIMLIDLERNDLGRVCQPGSVEVSELMVLETYAHVHHIVSNVRGKPRAGIHLRQLIHALFPGGTITGCPKVRCMQIIAELEGEARGAYTGSLGYLSRSGRVDSNILIRTFEWLNDQLVFRTGAGIVYDSIPEKELEETRHKAKGLLRAIEA